MLSIVFYGSKQSAQRMCLKTDYVEYLLCVAFFLPSRKLLGVIVFESRGVVVMRSLVYDLPIRFFHWIFAGLFLTSFVIAKTVDSESLIYSYHMLSGLMMGYLVLLRIFWGFFGTKHSRFTNFALNPVDLVNYFKGILTGDKKKWAGHNPASSWAGIVMMILALGLALTGYLMTSGNDPEAFEDVHEILANSFLIVVISHILGIFVHTLRHKELIGLSMLDGKKKDISPADRIEKSRVGVGLLLLALLAGFAGYFYTNFDSQKRSLNFLGTTLQLGEVEDGRTEKSDLSRSGNEEEHEEKESDED